ncbi:MAG: hypothetical protein JWO41_441 [Candidatus Saccharibacteria bacterium]|nr:hypothetical protein [Candidatus Saccharibacteria bacterium]
MLDTYEQHSKRKLAATLLSIVVIAGSIVFADHFKAKNTVSAATTIPTSQPTQATPATQSTPAPATPSTAATASSGYTDGNYSGSSSYNVPHGNESIQVNVELKDGVITSASIQNSEGDNVSASYQQDFASVYKSYVVGKKISGLQLGVIAGASDTTQGFVDALSQISSKAKA